MKTAPILLSRMSFRAFSMRARRSSSVIGWTPSSIGLRFLMASGMGAESCGRAQITGAKAAVLRKVLRFMAGSSRGSSRGSLLAARFPDYSICDVAAQCYAVPPGAVLPAFKELWRSVRACYIGLPAHNSIEGSRDDHCTWNSYGLIEILSLLGRGGMGEVWLAQNTHMKRKIALKLGRKHIRRILSACGASKKRRMRRPP